MTLSNLSVNILKSPEGALQVLYNQHVRRMILFLLHRLQYVVPYKIHLSQTWSVLGHHVFTLGTEFCV